MLVYIGNQKSRKKNFVGWDRVDSLLTYEYLIEQDSNFVAASFEERFSVSESQFHSIL